MFLRNVVFPSSESNSNASNQPTRSRRQGELSASLVYSSSLKTGGEGGNRFLKNVDHAVCIQGDGTLQYESKKKIKSRIFVLTKKDIS
jgi:hypothetical protein